MLFNSLQYLIFFPIVVLIYFVIPDRIKYLWLLFSSYFFYMCWNAKFGLLILFSTAVTYLCSICLQKLNDSDMDMKKKIFRKKTAVAISLILNFGVLAFFKYLNFLIGSVATVLGMAGINLSVETFDILLPVGISFFTFQAVGYTIDVYRENIEAEKNFFRYALFVSFFPQLVAGPIERSGNLLVQLKKPTHFDALNARKGLLTLAYGLFLKIVIADNIATAVDPVFDNYAEYSGMTLLMAVLLFAIQIYCDFNGYTKMAIGSARVLGYTLHENFNAPYLGVSIKDLWRRWHISLTSWFTDYLYVPLGGNRKGKFRKQINTLIVFLVSGLWHGAAWHYVFWGLINGLLSVFEDITKPSWNSIKNKLKIDSNKALYVWGCRVITFCVFAVTLLFFRAQSLGDGFRIFNSILTGFRWQWFLTGEFVNMFSSPAITTLLMLSILIMFVVDYLLTSGKDVAMAILNQQIVFRWIIYWFILMAILYLGVYGTDYVQTQFIYFQF